MAKKTTTIKDIRDHIESKIETVSDVMASRIYEVMTGRMVVGKDNKGRLVIVT